jgi:hypothetical protein
MKRTKPLKRSSWMRQRRATRRRSDRVRDPGILRAVRRLGCCARSLPGSRCSGRMHADHVGWRPYGRKSHDTQVIPLCAQCHADRTSASSVSGGPFACMTPEQRQDWCDEQVAKVQTWYYGRPLTEADHELVQEAVNDNRPTRGLVARAA